MGQWKLLCILITSLIVYTLYQRCNIEGLETPKKDKQSCNDDLTWFVEDRSGKKNYCKDIGKSASCYDIDAVGREGWERCKQTCGNCANTQVTKLPMNVLATFSGDPIEDFGIVMHIDKDRQWVGKQDGKGDDIRGYIDNDKDDDISNIMDRLSAAEEVFDIISGNVISCPTTGKKCKQGTQYEGCLQCLNCPSPGSPTPTQKHSYIKKVGDNIQFPAYDISCKNVNKTIKKITKTSNYGLTYIGCYEDKSVTGNREMDDLDIEKVKKKNIKVTKCDGIENCAKLTGRIVDKKNQCAKYCSAADAEYMGIQYGNQCFCSKKNPKDIILGPDLAKNPIDTCGIGGEKCFNKPEKCTKHNGVFYITSKAADFDIKKECKNLFRFDKILDKDDTKKKKFSDPTKKVTLYDMCPKQCGVTDECNK